MILHIFVSVEIGDVCDEIFLNTVLTVGTADTTLLHTSMETLDGLEVLTVDVGLAEFEFTAGLRGDVQVLGEDGRSESVLTVVGPLDGLIDGVSSWMMSICCVQLSSTVAA